MKTSLEPSSGLMKPNPFSALNHFTLPVAICLLLFLPATLGESHPLLGTPRDHLDATRCLRLGLSFEGCVVGSLVGYSSFVKEAVRRGPATKQMADASGRESLGRTG